MIKAFRIFQFLGMISILLPCAAETRITEGYGLPQTPRLTLWGLTGTDTSGKGDALFALWGQPDSFFFADIEGKMGEQSTWFGGAALGYRQNYQNARILGGYLFTDRSVSANNQLFWDISPGIESMGQCWDFRANGYFPVGSHTQWVGDFLSSQLNDYRFVQHAQHLEFDRLVQISDAVGDGADAEVGRVIPGTHHVRLYAGGYFFAPKDAQNIKGLSARLTLPINHHFAIEGRDTYDNVNHNTALISLRLTWGGISDDQTSRDIETRMMDPIERNLATQNTGTAIPVIANQKPLGEILARQNVWFFTNVGGIPFNSAAGINNCTYEHPCNLPSFNQNNLNKIARITPDAILYFRDLENTPLLTSGPQYGNAANQISIPNGQSLWGRTDDYNAPAPDDNRPIFLGSFRLLGNNSLNNLDIDGEGYQPGTMDPIIGIAILGANNIQLNNVGVSHYHGANGLNGLNNGTTGTKGTDGQSAIAIAIQNASNITLNHVTINDIQGGIGGNGGNGSDDDIGSTAGGAAGHGGSATGIVVTNASNVLMTNFVHISDVKGGKGGNGGNASGFSIGPSIAGAGSNGGSGNGIELAHSNHVTLNNISIDGVAGGAGGLGGTGSLLIADGNGTGGKGGAGGSANGISLLDSHQILLNQIELADLEGGDGAAGGGGSGKVGIGGAGGKGGSVNGLTIEDFSSNISIQSLTANILHAGAGGNGGEGSGGTGSESAGEGGNGGNGGAANAINISNSTLISAFGIVTHQLTGGLGGNGGNASIVFGAGFATGGNGGIGGSVNGINIAASSVVSIDGLIASDLTAGKGGDGGNGTVGMTLFGGTGTGGNAGNGGSAYGVTANGSSSISAQNINTALGTFDFGVRGTRGTGTTADGGMGNNGTKGQCSGLVCT